MRIPTDIGDSSRYTLPLPVFRLRTHHFSSMHTTPRKMCPRHQKICCKNPFPKMLSFFGFGTRRLFTVGCFIDISGAKTTQKHRSFEQLTQLTKFPARNIQKQWHFDYNLWNSPFSSTFHHRRKPALVHVTTARKTTLYRTILPPPFGDV